MPEPWLAAVLLCGVANHAMTATVTLRGSAGSTSATLTWRVANGAINVREGYRDTDSDPNGRVRIASLAATARRYTDSDVDP